MLGYFFLSHLILFKYHLSTFKYTHLIIFETQEYLCLEIFEKSMIQVHDKTILSVEFKSIIKAHDSKPWRFIHPKPNSHWQYQSPIFIGTTSSKRKESKIINAWQRKKYHVKMLPWQSSYEKTHWELSWGLCSHIIKPMKYMDVICIATSIIYTFKHSW